MMSEEQKVARDNDIKLLELYYGIEDFNLAKQRYYQLRTIGKLKTILDKARAGEHAPAKEEKDSNHCPKCGSDMVRKNGRNGPFLSCVMYPNCLGTRKIDQVNVPVSPEEMKTAKDYIQIAFEFIEKVGGVVNARLYLNIACQSLEERQKP